ncbi:MAG: type II secretion system F family protein, partial [Candidatus Omnitrophica bacterium]|nr:type II secretion system F family protein [Candidatus Omnitrophota bacterium]
MPTFLYTAKKSSAETVTGQINARSEEEAIDLISQLGLLPVSVSSKDAKGDPKKIRRRKIKTKELYVFSRQLASLIKSGVSLLRSIAIIEDQTTNPYFRYVLSQMGWDIKNGRSFSDVLKDYPDIFSGLYITMVRAGEESGNLQEMLMNVAEYKNRQAEMLSKVRMALAYPILMLFVGLGTVYFILSYVLPKMSTLFDSL